MADNGNLLIGFGTETGNSGASNGRTRKASSLESNQKH